MKVVIVGYGRMGREIESILKARGHTVVTRVDRAPGVGDVQVLTPEVLAGVDVAIEFSLPEGVAENIKSYTQAGVSAVLGTTGWENIAGEVKTLVEKSGIGLVHGTNFSVGAHMFFALVEQAAAMIKDITAYDIFVTEYHHKLKKDSPSGTALTTANRILRALPRKTEINSGRIDRQIRDEELHVASVRGGSIPGIHSVMLDSDADTLEIRHTARSRGGFALGAVLAAEWLVKNKKTGYIEVEEFAQDLLKGR
ncbi:MAG: 4-hydroxy-tetrahydrodipicolinate reductase [Spirochaetes bacterium GWB1_48_6]|nr:MAG: 4-hydroxy-tetrahydrodipicolinate reductase [Spirochaetes bacterium GWB1_48_6]